MTEQHLEVPKAHQFFAEMVLRRVRKQAARAGKWTCPGCGIATISANAPQCRSCARLAEALAESQSLTAPISQKD